MWFSHFIYLKCLLFGLNEVTEAFHSAISFCTHTDLKTDRCLHLAACHSFSDTLNPAAEGQIYKSDLDNKRQSVSKSGQWT